MNLPEEYLQIAMQSKYYFEFLKDKALSNISQYSMENQMKNMSKIIEHEALYFGVEVKGKGKEK